MNETNANVVFYKYHGIFNDEKRTPACLTQFRMFLQNGGLERLMKRIEFRMITERETFKHGEIGVYITEDGKSAGYAFVALSPEGKRTPLRVYNE